MTDKPTEVPPEITAEQLDNLIMKGDVTQIPTAFRGRYLYRLAERLGLNPLTRPFDFIRTREGGLVVYANRTASDQIRKNEELVTEPIYSGFLLLGPWTQENPPTNTTVYQVIMRIFSKKTPERIEYHTGCVGIDGISGEAMANAIMKCWTKATRRATLSYAGLGFPDESEVDSSWAAPAGQERQPAPGQPYRLVPAAQPPSAAPTDLTEESPQPTPPATNLPKALPMAKPPFQVKQ